MKAKLQKESPVIFEIQLPDPSFKAAILTPKVEDKELFLPFQIVGEDGAVLSAASVPLDKDVLRSLLAETE